MTSGCCTRSGAVSRRHFLALAGAVGALPALANRAAPGGAVRPPRQTPDGQDAAALVPVEIQVLQHPSPFMADGRAHLLYELHLTNFLPSPLVLQAIEVAAVGDPPAPLARSEGAELAAVLTPVGVAEPTADPLTLQPGARSMAFLWQRFDTLAQVPAALSHVLTFQPPAPDQTPRRSVLPEMPVLAQPPVVIGPPVYGQGWLAVNAASNTSPHRRTPLVLNGHLYFAQRYAIDLIQLANDGTAYRGDPARNEHWLCYRTNLVAVGDGVVIEVRDGIPENVPGEAPAVPITLDTVAGNYVVLDLGNGRYADYAHLIAGSIRVQPGDRVWRGDVLGLLGNSGNSTAPHLHFHVTNGPSFVGADGVPYAFDRVRIRKVRIAGGDDDEPSVEILSEPPRDAVQELVLENDLVDFAGPAAM
jgi:hypothetical protein